MQAYRGRCRSLGAIRSCRLQFQLTVCRTQCGCELGNVHPPGGLDTGPREMEPTMISLKVLSSAAAMALVLSLAPSASFAQNPGKAAFAARGGGGAPAARTGGGGPRMSGGAPAAPFCGVRPP